MFPEESRCAIYISSVKDMPHSLTVRCFEGLNRDARGKPVSDSIDIRKRWTNECTDDRV